MSNISPRNCRLNRSVSFVFLMTEKSVLTNLGPVTALRLRFPGGQVVLTQGDANSVANTALVPNYAESSPRTAAGNAREDRNDDERRTPTDRNPRGGYTRFEGCTCRPWKGNCSRAT